MNKYNRIIIFFILCSTIVTGRIYARQTTGSEGCSNPLKGYIRRISGDTILYRSYRNDVKWAMLTRATTGEMNIEWEAEPVPDNYNEAYACYTWIAGYSSGTSSGNRNFDLYLNNVKWFTFTTIAQWNGNKWEVTGKDNSTLMFELKTKDHINDVYGNIFMNIPAANFKNGKALKIKVVGENAGSNDWYMTFMHRMEEKASVIVQPALILLKGKEQQIIEVSIDHIRTDGQTSITIGNLPSEKHPLSLGMNRFEIPYPSAGTTIVVPVKITIDDKVFSEKIIQLAPVKKISFYLLHHSHNDIGYSDIQDTVEKKQNRNIYDAMNLVRKTASYPAGARFKWNVEILWAVENFLKAATDKEKKELIDAVRNGNIEFNALYAGVLTGLCRPEEFYRLTDYARKLQSEYGISVNCAMASDIPGFTWNIVPALAQCGIKYFTSGPNFMPGVPDMGDRVGGSNSTWGDRPFYWISPSGKEKILFWMAGKGYSWFHSWTLGRAGDNIKSDLFAYISYLIGSDYPYDMVQLRYTVNGDNGPTDPNLPDFVKSWNEKYVSPKLIISTTSEMFSHFEKKYGSVLPHYSGDFSPYWEDGALSTACELALTRNASERLVQAEILYSLAAPEKYNSKVFDEAWKNILLFDEHTWGAWNSISDPDAASVTQQWKIKQKFALNADSLSKAMLNNFIPGTRNFEIPESLEVINTNSWPRTDIVITRERTAGKNIVITGEDGNEVPSQLLSDGRVAFLASSVPPLGSKLYYVKEKSGSPQGVNINGEFPGFYNSNIRIVIDSITGNIKSILYKGNNLVNTSELNGLNEYLYIQGTDPDNRLTGNMPYISVKEDGPLLATIDICSDAAGCRHLDREVTLLKPFDRIDIRNTLDKEKVRDKEAVHFAFPFNITGGMLKYDLGWGTVTPGKDQLAGSCQDFWPVQRWLDISNEEFGITLSVNETPLIEPGSMTDETRNNNGYRRWKKIPSSSLILFMYVMNNYWHTNYKADQEGKVVFNYSLLLHGKSGISEANRFGIERSQPLIIRQASPGNYLSTSLFTINSTDVIVTSVKPVDKGKALIARLYNAGDTKAEITITPKDKGKSVYLSSPFEENGKMLNLIKLEPNEILTVKIQ